MLMCRLHCYCASCRERHRKESDFFIRRLSDELLVDLCCLRSGIFVPEALEKILLLVLGEVGGKTGGIGDIFLDFVDCVGRVSDLRKRRGDITFNLTWCCCFDLTILILSIVEFGVCGVHR